MFETKLKDPALNKRLVARVIRNPGDILTSGLLFSCETEGKFLKVPVRGLFSRVRIEDAAYVRFFPELTAPVITDKRSVFRSPVVVSGDLDRIMEPVSPDDQASVLAAFYKPKKVARIMHKLALM